uniref:SHS2 domain-containing protein n=1 Tax=Mesoaciditoga lauensis TaxID=1495039 RepID=A0A7V3RFE0_9BACT
MAKVGGGITVVDIGSYNIKAAIGEKVTDGFKILGYSTVKTNGFSSGQIIDAVGLKASIGEALGELQAQLVKKTFGGHLSITISENVFSLEAAKLEKSFGKPELIGNGQIQEIRSEISKGQDTIDAIPVRYTLDGNRKVINPLSMTTSKVAVDVVKVKMEQTQRNELINLFQGYPFESVMILHPGLVASEGTLNENEKNRGILCIDFGYSSIKLTAYGDGMPVDYKFLPFGTERMIKDIATIFKVSYPEAERLLFYHSNMDYERINENEMVEVVDFSKTKKNIKKRSISLAAYARGKELMSFSRRSFVEMLNNNPAFNPVGIVITGGGASIPGMSTLGATIFNSVARNGTYISSNNVMITGAEDIMGVPAYGPLFGAFVYAYRYGRIESVKVSSTSSSSNVAQPSVVEKTVEDKGESQSGNATFKKLWDFLKKLV